MRSALMSGGSTFAHLLTGRSPAGPKNAVAAEKPSEKDDEEAARAKKEEEDAKAEKDKEDEEKAAKEKEEEDARRAAHAGDDPNARGEEIFACAAAGHRPDVAAFLAFRTKLSAGQSIALLKMVVAGQPAAETPAPAPRGTDLRTRMAQEPHYEVAPETKPAQGGPEGLAAQIIAAGRKRRGDTASA